MLKKNFIEGDNRLVFNAILGKSNIPWQLDFIIQDINFHLQSFEDWKIQHIFRVGNQVTD